MDCPFVVEACAYSILLEFEAIISSIQQPVGRRECVLVCGDDSKAHSAFMMANRNIFLLLLFEWCERGLRMLEDE